VAISPGVKNDEEKIYKSSKGNLGARYFRMETLECIRTRRSIKKFKPDPVPDELIEKVLEAARWAPSGHNFQVCRYIVVKDGETREKLRLIATESVRNSARARRNWTFEEYKQSVQYLPEFSRADEWSRWRIKSSDEWVKWRMEKEREEPFDLSWPYEYVRQAPVIIVICANRYAPYLFRGKKVGAVGWMKDAFCNAENIILAAHDLGLGATLNTRVATGNLRELKRILNIPGDYTPVAVVCMGYSDVPELKVDKLPLEELVFYERFGQREKPTLVYSRIS